jgi:hypothetical protein
VVTVAAATSQLEFKAQRLLLDPEGSQAIFSFAKTALWRGELP